MAANLLTASLLVFLSPIVALGQLRPDAFQPEQDSLTPLFERVMAARDALRIPTKVEALPGAMAELDAILVQARQLQKAEGDSSAGKRYGLLVEGLDGLKQKLARVAILIERKEFLLAADAIDNVALLNQLWTGHPDLAHKEWAEEYREIAAHQDLPLKPLHASASRQWLAGEMDAARGTLLELLKRQREIYGNHHSQLRDTLIASWELRFTSGSLPESLSFLEEAVSISEQLYGPDSWQTLDLREQFRLTTQLIDVDPTSQKRIIRLWKASLNLSGVSAQSAPKVLATANREIGFAEQTLGPKNSLVPTCYIRFAGLAAKFDKLDYAVAFYLRGTTSAQQIFGNLHPLSLAALQGWSMTCRRMSDDQRAFELSTQAVHISRRLYGEGSEAYINALETHGMYYYEFKAYPQAQQVLEKVKRLRSLVHEAKGVKYAATLKNLGILYANQGKPEAARQELEAALQLIDDGDEAYVDIVGVLASLDFAAGNKDAAMEQQAQLTELARRRYGEDHIRFAQALENQACLEELAGRRDQAADRLLESLAITRSHLDRLGKSQGHRLRVNSYSGAQSALFHYLTLCTESAGRDAQAYEQVSMWKGTTLRQGHVLAQAKEAQSDSVFDQKRQTIADAISNYLTVVDTRSRDLVELTRLDEMIQAWEDVHRNQVFQEGLEYDSSSVQQIQSAVPANTVLVDFFQYDHMLPTNASSNDLFEARARFLAFVVCRDHPVKMIQIGAVDEIEKIIFEWRRQLKQPGSGNRLSALQVDTPEREFYERIWRPIATAIGDAQHIMVCPDGMLGLVPWAAAPISLERRYLIEDYVLTVLPYAEFLVQASRARSVSDARAMTLVGNLDYLAPLPGDSAGRVFSALPGTARETAALALLFKDTFPEGRLTTLEEQQGSELNVRLNAQRSNYLHIATHGFFAPEIWQTHTVSDTQAAFRQRVRVMVPETLSALVLAGANRGLSSREAQQPKAFGSDGILTGLEVSSMDLRNLDLVTLSACETGLGSVAAGVGKLGLEQAFLAAGANSVVSSLWQVDDAATATLMVEFYKNIWSNGMSKSEALRAAQLALLDRYDRNTRELHPRGLKLANKPSADQSNGRLAPYYWAPFILTGSWR